MGLFSTIKEDFLTPFEQDPAICSRVEIFFNYPGVWALVNYRVASKLHEYNFKRLARILMGITQMLTGVDIHPGAKIGHKVFFDHAVGIVIGESAIIEDNVLIYQGVTLGGVSLQRGVKRHPTIKQGSVIGSGAKVLGNITIGKNCKIGSNSVVVKDVPDECTAVGIPARILQRDKTHDVKEHNKLPDINKELFDYLFKRIKLLESKDPNCEEFLKEDKKLEEIYEIFIKTLKE